jgi:hypothetical protein
MSKDDLDPSMRKVLKLVEKSGKTLDEIGVAMGYPAETARQSVWQWLRKTKDPRVSVLRRFAKAIDADVRDLL